MVGILIYLTYTRPDIGFVVNFISSFMTAPKVSHWKDAKRILRNVKGTLKFGIEFTRSEDFKLTGYTDSNWAGSVDDKRSTLGYVFNLGTGAFS